MLYHYSANPDWRLTRKETQRAHIRDDPSASGD